MEQIKILKFLKENISPLSDEFYGPRYRASVYLKDGTFLPYVLFSSEKKNIAYDKNLDYSDIEKIEKCKNAFSLDILNQIKGETLMSWTGFVVKMKDGKCFNFGTTFSFLFFDFPEGYSSSDIVEVINHSYIDENNEIKEYRKHSLEKIGDIKIYHQIDDYYICHLDKL
jgi:hypothetical protein